MKLDYGGQADFETARRVAQRFTRVYLHLMWHQTVSRVSRVSGVSGVSGVSLVLDTFESKWRIVSSAGQGQALPVHVSDVRAQERGGVA